MRVLLAVVALAGGIVVVGPAHAAPAVIRDFKAVQGRDGYVAVTGRVVQDGAAVAGAAIELTYVPKGRPGDSLFVPLKGDTAGRFALRGQLPHDGTWTVVYGSVSRTITSNTKYVTRVVKADATPERPRKGGTVKVTGGLQQFVGSPIDNGSWRSLKKRNLTVWFQAKGAKKWVRKGAYGTSFKATRDGSWQIRYSGGTDWLRSTSKPDYIDVR